MIISKENPHFKRLLRLHKRKEREEEGFFLVEGERELSLAKGIETIYYTEGEDIKPFCKQGIETIQIAKDLFERISYRDKGMIGIVKTFHTQLEALKQASFLLVASGIEKPGNLGAMMRTSDAAGVEGMIIADPEVDLFNPNVIRASLGAFFTLPVAQGKGKEIHAFLKKEGFHIVVTSPYAKKSIYEIDFTQKIAIVIGSEANGLDSMWLQDAEGALIPMQGNVDSLNASISAAVIIYEAYRQRNTLSR
jgi:TrmH family RNA methyltransferase